MKHVTFSLMLILLMATSWQTSASVPLGGNRKGVGGSYDMYGCMQSNDYYVVNFAAYQVDPNQSQGSKNLPQAECIDLPKAGKTQISVDLLDLDIRKKAVALKIFREDGQTVAELPMSLAKHGVLSTTADFKTAGNYQAVITVDDTDLNTPLETSALHIPLTVGLVSEQTNTGNNLLILLLGIGATIGILAYYMPRLLRPDNTESMQD